jgi:hypothetical protein
MARPLKSGLDYYPLDCGFFENDKIEIISAEFSSVGSLIVLRLLCKIYQHGYFCRFGKNEITVFCRKASNEFDPTDVNNIINRLTELGFFDKNIYDKYQILTSKGIQERYFKAVELRKSIAVKRGLLLIKLPENKKDRFVFEDEGINSEKTPDVKDYEADYDIINSQSKVKNIRQKEIKLEGEEKISPAQDISFFNDSLSEGEEAVSISPNPDLSENLVRGTMNSGDAVSIPAEIAIKEFLKAKSYSDEEATNFAKKYHCNRENTRIQKMRKKWCNTKGDEIVDWQADILNWIQYEARFSNNKNITKNMKGFDYGTSLEQFIASQKRPDTD